MRFLNKTFKNKPVILFALIVAAWFTKDCVRISVFGAEPLGHADGFSEIQSRDGASHFIKNGILKTAFLPVWPKFYMETDIPFLRESRIYTHYFPGPDYVLTAIFWMLGESDLVFQWARLVPLLCLFFSFLFLARQFQKQVWDNWAWGSLAFACFVLFVPGMRYWSINLHGHAYSTSLIFCALAIGVQPRRIRFEEGWLFAIGFCSNMMLLTAAFVVAGAPLVANFLNAYSANLRLSFKRVLWVSIGLVFAFLIHFWQVAIVLDSWKLAFQDQIGVAFSRGLQEHGNGITRLMLLGRYSDDVGRFFWVQGFSMIIIGSVFVYLQRVSKNIQRQRFMAIGLATLACYLWVFAMKNHAVDHPHVNPRIFILLYVAFVSMGIAAVASLKKQ